MPILTITDLLDKAAVPITASEILADLKPPCHFESAEFSTYIPQPNYPSQLKAVETIAQFFSDKDTAHTTFIKRLFAAKQSGRGLYLDGGFGVGKTHLLAASYHSYHGKKAYLSFQELMFLVGLQKLDETVHSFKHYDILVIDEFELDDPANSRISTNLLGQLLDSGVNIITSSNTPPGALGKERFSNDDFIRELGNLTEKFVTIRIDGDDYRALHPFTDGLKYWLNPQSDDFTALITKSKQSRKRVADLMFGELVKLLASSHPMRIRQLMHQIDVVIIRDFEQFAGPADALRFVYFIDKCYDNNIRLLVSSEISIDDIFHYSYFSGGDTKKYRRTLSRLHEMTRD